VKHILNTSYFQEILVMNNWVKAEIFELKIEFLVEILIKAVFCWIHPKTKATLWRSSQTKSGVTSQRCNEDERLLKLIGGLSDDHIIIFDARPYLSAMANRVNNIIKIAERCRI